MADLTVNEILHKLEVRLNALTLQRGQIVLYLMGQELSAENLQLCATRVAELDANLDLLTSLLAELREGASRG